ncbi:hypothetical protein Tco_1516558 [Tanacetum coccineum]
MSMSVQKSQVHKTATRSQDDNKRLCLVDDLKEAHVHIQVKLIRICSSLKSKITTSCSQDEVKKTSLVRLCAGAGVRAAAGAIADILFMVCLRLIGNKEMEIKLTNGKGGVEAKGPRLKVYIKSLKLPSQSRYRKVVKVRWIVESGGGASKKTIITWRIKNNLETPLVIRTGIK